MDILQRYIGIQNDQYSKYLDLPEKRSEIYVVIPCYNEPDVVTTLNSLAGCYPPKAEVTVLIVINWSQDAPEEAISQNLATIDCISEWQQNHTHLFFDVQRIVAASLPRKWAGVGWARKIGMDAAVRQLAKNGDSDGILISFDADSTVSPGYLQTIESAFENNPTFNFFTIHFEHPYDDPNLNAAIREGIIRYELHMRYYRNAMELCGYPHAIHTVGSSFALKASAYAKQGGMNRRKAGEDFYFLHKLVLLGHYGNIASTTVFPSARLSDRVPFGTGAAIKKWAEGSSELRFTYSLEAFKCLLPLFSGAARFWLLTPPEIRGAFINLHPSLQKFIENSNTADELIELKVNCSNAANFEKRVFHLLNAFWILKYLNFAHGNYFERGDLLVEATGLLQHIGIQIEFGTQIEKLLEIFRNLDKGIENCS